MTRINLVPPEELCDQHLLAEWRELPRLALAATKAAADCKLPEVYVLGAGHMKFFYDKGIFLERRHRVLTAELKARGFKLTEHPPFVMSRRFGYHDYEPTLEALELNRARIADRMPVKPRFSSQGCIQRV